MKLLPHLIAAIVTVLAIVTFQLLRGPLDFQFGFRSYWPAFLCAYLVIWYYVRRIRKRDSG